LTSIKEGIQAAGPHCLTVPGLLNLLSLFTYFFKKLGSSLNDQCLATEKPRSHKLFRCSWLHTDGLKCSSN